MHIFKYKIKKYKENSGYAILFTIVVVGIISMITMGMTNAVLKQTVLASVAKDSTAAFYQADLASECALLFDNEMDIGERLLAGLSGTFKCADKNLIYNIIKSKTTSGFDKYTTDINPIPVDFSGTDKCVRMTIIVDESQSPIFTKVDARGYNICDTSKLRTVERSLQVTYGGGGQVVQNNIQTSHTPMKILSATPSGGAPFCTIDWNWEAVAGVSGYEWKYSSSGGFGGTTTTETSSGGTYGTCGVVNTVCVYGRWGGVTDLSTGDCRDVSL